jgi:hypothetical protein
LATKNNKKAPKKSKIGNYLGILVILIIIAAIVIYQVWQGNKVGGERSDIAAIVNGEVITNIELESEYGELPEQYKAIISEEDYLNQMIVVILLLQEAKSKDIEVKEWEVMKEIDEIKERELITTEEEFNTFIGEIGLSVDELETRIEEQIMIDKLLEVTIDPTLEVTDSMVESFYEKYQENFYNVSLDKIRFQVEEALKRQLRDGAIQIYIKQLKAKAEIQITGEEPIVTEVAEEELILTFEETGDELCTEKDQPIVRLYSASSSSKSQWTKDIFATIAEDKDIVAYHWELDTGDDLLTEDIEKAIPKSEVEVFKQYSPEGQVPLFVFGCKYVRIGNGHEDLALEEQEFRDIIENIK